MRKIYISGGITGVEDYKERFAAEEKVLEVKGYEVVNPVKVGEKLIEVFEGEKNVPYCLFMRADLKALLECTHIYMLDNWYKSKGAIIEYIVAKVCGLKVVHQGVRHIDFLPWSKVVILLSEVTKNG